MFKLNLNPFYDVDGAIGGAPATEPTPAPGNADPTPAAGNPTPNQDPTPQPEKTFTQSDVDRIVGERLGRERQKYSPYQSFVETEAKRNSMTPEQYLQAVEQQRQAEERQNYINQGVNPDLINQLIEKNPIVQSAQKIVSKSEQDAKFQAEANEFFQSFPDVEVKNIPPEVYKLKAEKGISLTDAYLRVNYSKLQSNTEQDVLRKLQTNSQSSPGALSQGAGQPTNSISKMSKADFLKLQQEVLRGERKQL